MTFRDQLGNTIKIVQPPQRIVSLVPSQSEFLWDLGLRAQLKGITKFCIHPDEMFKNVPRVGGTKNLNLKKIKAINPDLIIGNQEENDETQIKELQKKFTVWMSDIKNFDDAFDMMTQLGKIMGKEKKAIQLTDEIKLSAENTKNIFKSERVAYLIWRKPWMLAGSDTFIDFVINHTGLKNAASHWSRYPAVDENKLAELQPELCFLSSEPYPFKEKHRDEIQKIWPHTKIILINGEMFSWYGTRMKKTETYFKSKTFTACLR